MSIKWTDQEAEIFKKMLEAHKTPEEVAQVFKSRSADGIRNKAQKMGLKWGYEPELDMDAFHKLMKGNK